MKTAARGSVLVTGGVKRLGGVIAETLRERGWRVITSSHRTDAGADVVADLADPLGPARLYVAASQCAGGALDAIVNNAALFTGDETALRRVNLEAPQKLTMMLAGREGAVSSIVNILDAHALTPNGETSPYLETKRELLAYTRRSALLFAQSLRVNAVAPGAVIAPENAHVAAGEMLLDRRPTPQDVAEAVAFLLEAKATTGMTLPVDAGANLLADF